MTNMAWESVSWYKHENLIFTLITLKPWAWWHVLAYWCWELLWIPGALARQLRLLDKFRVSEKPYLSKQL